MSVQPIPPEVLAYYAEGREAQRLSLGAGAFDIPATTVQEFSKADSRGDRRERPV